jgi:bifunctional lysine-specific demethylase and histidyl-hydroxylase NO66
MSAAHGSLAWLVDPVPVDEFLSDIWGKRHHRIERGSPGYFDGLFDAPAIERYIEYSHPDHSEIRLVRKNDKKPLELFRLANGRVDLVRVRNDFAEGYTIILNGLEQHIPTIAAIAREIEVELNFEVQINAYVTPPASQGFLPHYDDHDVLIVQIEGAKTWQIYDSMGDVPTRELRLRELFMKDELSEPSRLKLSAGDLLYIPRGRVHAASAEEQPSTHLTIGIYPPTVLTLASKALESLGYRNDLLFSRLPPRFLSNPSVRTSLSAFVREAVSLIDERAVGDAVGAIEDQLLRRGHCRSAGHLIANASETRKVSDRTIVRKCAPIYSRVLAIDQGVALQFAQSLVSAGADHKDAMMFISGRRDPFTVGEIPGLSRRQQKELARKLLVDGLLVRVED